MAGEIFTTPESGKRLLGIINAKNINLTEMANSTGLSRSTIYSFLYNGTDISSMRLMKLCAYCGISTDYVLGMTDRKDPHRAGRKVKTAVYDGENCIGVFPSLKQASEFVGVKVGSASRILNGMYKTTRGRYSFKEVTT